MYERRCSTRLSGLSSVVRPKGAVLIIGISMRSMLLDIADRPDDVAQWPPQGARTLHLPHAHGLIAEW